MLSNAYFLAKFRFDTAENEPAKDLQNFAKFANFADPQVALPAGRRPAPRSTLGWDTEVARRRMSRRSSKLDLTPS